MAGHVVGGAVKAGSDLVKFGRSLNVWDPYNVTHPALYLDSLSTTAGGLIKAGDHPTELLSSLVGSGWGSDPAEAFGKALTNLAAAPETAGGSAAVSLAEREAAAIAEKAAQQTAKEAAETAAREAAERAARDAAENATKNADRLKVATTTDFDVNALTHNPVWRETTEPLWRFDRRSPEEIFERGFQPWNTTELNLRGYASADWHSVYVGTTRDPNLTLGKSRDFRYDIDAPGGIDINATFDGDTAIHSKELEIAFPGGIKSENIKGARQVFADGTYGDFIPNPNYRPSAGANPPPAPGSHLPKSWTNPAP